MIQRGTRLIVCDGSGGLSFYTFQIYRRRTGRTGSIVRGSLRSVVKYKVHKHVDRTFDPIVRGGKVFGIINETRYPIRFSDGTTIRFTRNTCALAYNRNLKFISKSGVFDGISTRLSGSLTHIMRYRMCI